MVVRAKGLAADRADVEMVDYLGALAVHHRATGKSDDLLGTWVAAHDADDGALSEDEQLGNFILLFVVAPETTTNLLGNGLLTLMRHEQSDAKPVPDGHLNKRTPCFHLKFVCPSQYRLCGGSHLISIGSNRWRC